MDEQTAERFWKKIVVAGPDECWLWSASRYRDGYGQFGLRAGKVVAAHRVAWMSEHGEPPPGLVLRHRCDVKLCCNPRHLELGTQADNMRDMVGRGRSCKGSKNPRAKLNEDQVREILGRLGSGATQAAMARAYGVSNATVSLIANGINWGGVRINMSFVP
jgi:hypothetical protein